MRYNVTIKKLKRWSGNPCSWEWYVHSQDGRWSTTRYAGWRWTARWGARAAIRDHESKSEEIKYVVDTADDV